MMQQIILQGGIALPRRSNDCYACYEEELSQTIVMASGRMVKELRNRGGRFKIWKVRCSYDLLEDEVYRAALALLRSGTAFHAAVLPDNGAEMVSATFLTEELTPATFAFEEGGNAVWRGLAFTLREVSPHA